jgi:hypothetical protein
VRSSWVRDGATAVSSKKNPFLEERIAALTDSTLLNESYDMDGVVVLGGTDDWCVSPLVPASALTAV